MKRDICVLVALGVAAAGGCSRPTDAPQGEKPTMRDLVVQKTAQDLPNITNAAQLDAYLAGLAGQARKNGKTTALEAEPGLRAIEKFRAQLGDEAMLAKLRAFANTMETSTPHPERKL